MVAIHPLVPLNPNINVGENEKLTMDLKESSPDSLESAPPPFYLTHKMSDH
jgi:hypothetical protein